jgi:hypothetical protein
LKQKRIAGSDGKGISNTLRKRSTRSVARSYEGWEEDRPGSKANRNLYQRVSKGKGKNCLCVFFN